MLHTHGASPTPASHISTNTGVRTGTESLALRSTETRLSVGEHMVTVCGNTQTYHVVVDNFLEALPALFQALLQ